MKEAAPARTLRQKVVGPWMVGSFLVLSFCSSHARSDEWFPGFSWNGEPAVFINPGLTIGGSTHFPSGVSGVVGLEISAGYWNRGFYAGLVFDSVGPMKETSWSNASHMMFGPMIGFMPVGLDGGYLIDTRDGKVHHGGALRLFLSAGFLDIYAKVGFLRDISDFIEFGVILKIPVLIWSGS